jgi:hypothetical protein
LEAHQTRAEAPAPAERLEGDRATKPTGPVAAVMIAAGIGALVLAILTVWAEASEGFKESLAYSDRVGPLSGKTIWAAVAFFASWGILSLGLRRRQVDLAKATMITVVLLGLGYLGTFAPFFRMFAPD